MAIHLGTFETTQFPDLSLLRVFIFKVHFPSFACSHGVLKHQMYLLASIMCLKKKKEKNHIRRSVEKFMNTKYRSAECLLLLPTPMSLKHSFVYSPGLITMPLTFPPNSMINLEIRSTGSSPPPTW